MHNWLSVSREKEKHSKPKEHTAIFLTFASEIQIKLYGKSVEYWTH